MLLSLLSSSQAAIMSDRVPVCSFCAATVKPDVVFFGEDLPQKYFLHTEDFPRADLLIIMGTSLQVCLHTQPAPRAVSLNRSRPHAADRALRQPGEHRARHRSASSFEPARRGPLPEGPAAERGPHGAGRPGGHGSEVCRNARLDQRDLGADERPRGAGASVVSLLKCCEGGKKNVLFNNNN